MPRTTLRLTDQEIELLDGLKDHFDTSFVSETVHRSIGNGATSQFNAQRVRESWRRVEEARIVDVKKTLKAEADAPPVKNWGASFRGQQLGL